MQNKNFLAEIKGVSNFALTVLRTQRFFLYKAEAPRPVAAGPEIGKQAVGLAPGLSKEELALVTKKDGEDVLKSTAEALFQKEKVPGVKAVNIKLDSLPINMQVLANELARVKAPAYLLTSYNAFLNKPVMQFVRNGDHYETRLGAADFGQLVLSFDASGKFSLQYFNNKAKEKKGEIKTADMTEAVLENSSLDFNQPLSAELIPSVQFNTGAFVDVATLAARNEKLTSTVAETKKELSEQAQSSVAEVNAQITQLNQAAQDFSDLLNATPAKMQNAEFQKQSEEWRNKVYEEYKAMTQRYTKRAIYVQDSDRSIIFDNVPDRENFKKAYKLFRSGKYERMVINGKAEGEYTVSFYKKGNEQPVEEFKNAHVKPGSSLLAFEIVDQEYRAIVQQNFKEFCQSQKINVPDEVYDKYLGGVYSRAFEQLSRESLPVPVIRTGVESIDAQEESGASLPPILQSVPEENISKRPLEVAQDTRKALTPASYLQMAQEFLASYSSNDFFKEDATTIQGLGLENAKIQGIKYQAAKQYFEKKAAQDTTPDNKTLCLNMLDAIAVLDQLYKNGRDAAAFSYAPERFSSTDEVKLYNSDIGANVFAQAYGVRNPDVFKPEMQKALEALCPTPAEGKEANFVAVEAAKAFLQGALLDTVRRDQSKNFVATSVRGDAFIPTLQENYLEGIGGTKNNKQPLMSEVPDGELKESILTGSASGKILIGQVLNVLGKNPEATQIKVGDTVIDKEGKDWAVALNLNSSKLIEVRMVSIPGRLNESVAFKLRPITIITPPAVPEVSPAPEVPARPALIEPKPPKIPSLLEQEFFKSYTDLLSVVRTDSSRDKVLQDGLEAIDANGDVRIMRDKRPNMKRIGEGITMASQRMLERFEVNPKNPKITPEQFDSIKNQSITQLLGLEQAPQGWDSKDWQKFQKWLKQTVDASGLSDNAEQMQKPMVEVVLFRTPDGKILGGANEPEVNLNTVKTESGQITTWISNPEAITTFNFETSAQNNLINLLLNRYKLTKLNQKEFAAAQKKGAVPDFITYSMYEQLVGRWQGSKGEIDPAKVKAMLQENAATLRAMLEGGAAVQIDKPVKTDNPLAWLVLIPIIQVCIPPKIVVTVAETGGGF